MLFMIVPGVRSGLSRIMLPLKNVQIHQAVEVCCRYTYFSKHERLAPEQRGGAPRGVAVLFYLCC